MTMDLPRPEPYIIIRTMIAVDIVSFSNPARTDHIQVHLRKTLYGIVHDALVEVGVPWDSCYTEDRGDGLLVAIPPHVPQHSLLDFLALELAASVRRHNMLASAPAQLRLRVAVHAGGIRRDDYGLVGTAINHLFRLIDSPQLKEVMEGTNAEIGFIVSDHFYNEVIRHGLGVLDPANYQPLNVRAKETVTRGWTYMPSPSSPDQNQEVPQDTPSGSDPSRMAKRSPTTTPSQPSPRYEND